MSVGQYDHGKNTSDQKLKLGNVNLYIDDTQRTFAVLLIIYI